MPCLDSQRLQRYRLAAFCTQPGQRLHSKEEAIAWVNRLGFVFFWPIKNVLLPSLWEAVAGDRPVADAHDDPGHITWGWKDELLGKRAWYYAKVLRKRATMISFELAPYFYALSENYGSPEEDYLTLYEQGRLTLEAKQVYEAVLDHGPLDTIALRKAARMTSQESDARFNKALTDLQADFKIVPIGVAQVGAWNYAFIYDIALRYYPELLDLEHTISERQARQRLARAYLHIVGAAQRADVAKLFGWRPQQVETALKSLVSEGSLVGGLELEGKPGEWFAIPELT